MPLWAGGYPPTAGGGLSPSLTHRPQVREHRSCAHLTRRAHAATRDVNRPGVAVWARVGGMPPGGSGPTAALLVPPPPRILREHIDVFRRRGREHVVEGGAVVCRVRMLDSFFFRGWGGGALQ